MNFRGIIPPRGRSRGRGRGRGGASHQDFSGPSSSNVPSVQQVVPGAGVSIVLKEDQPTGHEVQGIVGEVLTKGNHPRGIKVRLRDGRVGRVQRMVKDGGLGTSEPSGLILDGPTEVPENAVIEQMETTSIHSRPAPAPSKYSDFRNDGYDPPPSVGLSLEDYVVVKKSKGKGKGQKKKMQEVDDDVTPDAATLAATSTCPVCGEFEGDETAVAHHVNEHFE